MRHTTRVIIAVLPILFLAAHAGTVALARDAAMEVSFAWLIGAPVAAGAAALYRGWKEELEGWLSVGAAMLCWAGGMAATMVNTLFLDIISEDRLSMLLYVLYGVPLIFTLVSPEEEKWPSRLVDAAMAAALGGLFYAYICHLSTPTGAAPQVRELRMMFDIENAFIAVFAVMRYFARPGRRLGFFRAVTAYAIAYLICAGYMNHYQGESDYGHPVDAIIDLPFLLLMWLALEGGFPRASATASSRGFARVVQAGSPMLIPVTLLTVSVLLVGYDPKMAITGCVIASIGYGLRTVLVQLRNFEEQDQLTLLSHVDALTCIPNRRRFDEVLRREWNRREQSSDQLALLMIDIDNFKQLNDHFGHAVGDERLRSVAAALTECARSDFDLVARYGGEEFAAILIDIDPRDATKIAERMRAAVESLLMPLGRGAGIVTVSIGMACAHSLDTGIEDFVEAADAALYEAKRNGRNQVIHRVAPSLRAVQSAAAPQGGKAA
ncbi:diguanylate cyclase [Novosphingobium barchaimii LL02]|uniref:diguanylate cyclase n=1 Tax=Novosphingobium barchaimii LL02 TaxID=1114963 RepID=A0A0J7XLN9_9SPHN|nr:GGDEF domain-containing protein [Novosphingobium barchaimii]KMS52569.1 diguanylate cyclase [Novosphingobium barchaimii LL02]